MIVKVGSGLGTCVGGAVMGPVGSGVGGIGVGSRVVGTGVGSGVVGIGVGSRVVGIGVGSWVGGTVGVSDSTSAAIVIETVNITHSISTISRISSFFFTVSLPLL